MKRFKRPKKKFPTADAIEYVKSLEQGASKVKKTPKKTKGPPGKKTLEWSKETTEGSYIGSGEAADRLGRDGALAMLKSVPLSSASAGRYLLKPMEGTEAFEKVKAAKKHKIENLEVRLKRKRSKRGRLFASKSTKAPRPQKPQ
eukprot:Protomagalhaensia_sp_Gyna_25__3064@NODE_2818_length_873_cov_118_651079_g2351_i0_p1_GENE_NODE_2818_length_873_cov_118_651079_g2351_i0NODE_2818_length_873_cov_118_651079_g2351_i0_p1_ORF_typecomplete_len144_score33_54Striatin/PF08232_12/2_4e02Striatin/PF08232_12/1_6_NODE_2818_length_873_cov_118_651079_g2351_i0348779